MAYTKSELETKYNVPVFAQWRSVPANLHPRSWYSAEDILIPRKAKPDGVKGGGFTRRIYFLFDERKWLSDERLKRVNTDRRPVI